MKKLGFLLFPALALGTGLWSARLVGSSFTALYLLLEKSPLFPPPSVFPVVWTVLYILMGIGLACVVQRGGKGTGMAIFLWGSQLALNFSWSLLFFGYGAYWAALVCLGALWVLILLMILFFHSVSRFAAWLQIPYFLWVSFAGYLNLMICLLNP